MKRIITICAALVMTASVFAQAPQKMSYQAVVRDGSNNLVSSSPVGMRIGILQGSSSGTAVYVETQTPTSNTNGLVSLEIGSGVVVSGTFATIDWANGPYFIKTETDPTGGTSYTIIGTSELVSVPYALHAGSSANTWTTTGNAGTNPTTDYIGTADNVPFNIKVNNTPAGHIGIATDNSVFLGLNAGLNDDATNNSNTFIGNGAGLANTNGFSNTANGFEALKLNTTGAKNTAIGMRTLLNNTTGFNNSATGVVALYSNTTGNDNTATGVNALNANTTGISNTATGSGALKANTTASDNTAVGFEALKANTTGVSNTATGSRALLSNTTGSNNTANGVEALKLNTTGGTNTANGYHALFSNTIGSNNTANGHQALGFNSDGIDNTAIGVATLFFNTSGSKNVATGKSALSNNSTGSNNVAVGNNALLANTTASNNTAVGFEALKANTTGDRNVSMGSWSLFSTTTGIQNTAIGYFAGNSGNFSNRIAIGYNVQNTASNQVRIGNNAVTSIGGFAGWTNVSDRRFKTGIKESVLGLDFIMNLRPVTYHLDMDAIANFLKTPEELRLKEAEQTKAAELQTGFIAQEVEEAAKKSGIIFSGVDAPKNEGDYYGLRYAEFVVPLVKAVQEQQEMIKNQQQEINELKALVNKLR